MMIDGIDKLENSNNMEGCQCEQNGYKYNVCTKFCISYSDGYEVKIYGNEGINDD